MKMETPKPETPYLEEVHFTLNILLLPMLTMHDSVEE